LIAKGSFGEKGARRRSKLPRVNRWCDGGGRGLKT